ncbi:MAG: hypothetical protein NC389_17280 [Acetatifactor muris]|nr:hypothetical protein [Acetatifactor muris]
MIMRKKAAMLAALMISFFMIGCAEQAGETVAEGMAVQQESGENTVKSEDVQKQAGEETQPESTEESAPKADRSDAEVKKQELTLELRWNAYEKLRDQAKRYEQLEKGLSEEEVQELIQSKILQCYEENTLLAVEIKTVVMGSLGCPVPSGFTTGDDVMAAYGDYVMGTISSAVDVQGVIDDIASPEVQEILKNGVEGALSAYDSGGNLTDILEEAATSVTIGVVARIQDQVQQFTFDILNEASLGMLGVVQEMSKYDSLEEYLMGKADEKTGGLIGDLMGIATYDASPGALFQGITDSASAAAAELKAFLERDMVTSEEIAKVMYQYSLFGNAMWTLFQFGGASYFNWEPHYDKMELLYKRFLYNEIMIEMLSQKGDIVNPEVSAELAVTGGRGTAQSLEYIKEKPALTPEEQLLDNNAKYDILAAAVERVEAAITETESWIESGTDVEDALEEYRNQLQQVSEEYEGILNYSVENFEAQYDNKGISDARELNKKQNAIGQIAKYTPYGIVLNWLTSATIAGSDSYYENMQKANVAFGEAYQTAVLKARDAASAMGARTDFYNELVGEQEDVWDEYVNLCLLRYMVGDGGIHLEEYGQEAKKELYLLALQTDALSKIYGAVYSDKSAANAYIAQYKEIMELVDPYGTGEVAALVTREEISEALLPIMQAGVTAIQSIESVQAPNMDKKYIMVYRSDGAPGGKVYYCLLGNQMIRAHHQDNWFDLCFFNGEPLYINGYYVYNGMLLNGSEEMDETVIGDEGRWIYQNVRNERGFGDGCALHVGNMRQALGQNW